MFSFKNLIDAKGKAVVMGILNITPDSFSDGGEFFDKDSVIKKVNTLCNQGADIIDVGACSTAPGNSVVTLQEELQRVESFLPVVIANATVPVSIDTFRAEVAEYALSQGVRIVNDESGKFNPQMATVVKKYGAGWIFMHTGGGDSKTEVVYGNGVVNDVLAFFEDMRQKALEFGLSEEQLCYDCGIGFGKTRQDDVAVLKNCRKLSRYSPLLVGVSRKRVIGELCGIEDKVERDTASAVVGALAVQKGASVIRAHNVPYTVQAIEIYDSLKTEEII